jgi:hypothetical protein
MSETEAPAAAFSRWHESEINRPRNDVGAKATLAGASDCLPHQDWGGGGAGSFAEIPAINAPGNRRRILRPPATTQTIADGRQ